MVAKFLTDEDTPRIYYSPKVGRLSKDPRAEHVALLLAPIGGKVVAFSRLPLMR